MAGRRLTWLHLSDLHVETRKECVSRPARDQERCWKALAEDIAELRTKEGNKGPVCTPDFIVLSGDVVKRGVSEASFKLAHTCVGRWCEAASVPADRVFVIPGNHDIDQELVPPHHIARDANRPGLLDMARHDSHALREAVDEIWDSQPAMETIESKFANYRAFAERYAPVEWGPMHSWRMALEIEGAKVQIIGLNSVWTGGATELDRPGMPVVGDAQREWLEEASQDKAEPDVSFVLQHNPISYLHSVDSLAQSNWLDERDAVVLSGHLHQSELAERRSVRGRHLELLGGALYVDYHWHRGYSFGVLRMDEDKRRFTIGLRSHAPNNDFFSWDMQRRGAKDGLVKFSQEISSPNLGATLEAGGQLAIELERARLTFDGNTYLVQIEKTYVNPTPYAWPYAEAHVLVNAFPDDPERARALYREHPLDLDEIGFSAQCNGEQVEPTLLYDLESSKRLLIPFGRDGEEDSELQPGSKAVLAYSFRIDKALWGPYFERHVNRETKRIECELSFPRGSLADMTLRKNPRLSSESLDEELVREEAAGSVTYRWHRDRPRLQSRYRFLWSFAEVKAPAPS
jgi:3',5'-cyclic AMP phosphodiesterase CpdA